MKKIDGNKIAIAVGVIILAIATWFAARPPTPPAIGLTATPATSTTSAPTSPTDTLTTAPIQKSKPGSAGLINITLTSPTAGVQWIIGKQNTISWNKPAGVAGQMWLVNAATGAIVGWILQSVGPAQLYYPWNTRDVFLSETNPSAKNVMPGKYIIKMSFTSPGVPSIASAPFSIIASSTQSQ